MKRGGVAKARMSRIRHFMSGAIVFAVFLIVPAMFIMQITGFSLAKSDERKATPLPAFQTRYIDAADKNPQLFSEPLLTVTFDDGWESVYSTAMPLLQKAGIQTTQYVLSGVESDSHYLSWDQMTAIQKAGHEIACHSATHPDLTTLDDVKLKAELLGCAETLGKHYGKVTDFASPYGSQDDRTLKAINKYFASQRNTNGDASNGVTDADVNLKSNFDPMNVIGVTIHNTTTVEELANLIAYAKAHNGWIVLTYHQADEDSSQYGLDQKGLQKQLDFLSRSDIRIVTMQQAINSYKRP